VTQLTGYLVLLEFGMAGSVSRFLADHKDDINWTVPTRKLACRTKQFTEF